MPVINPFILLSFYSVPSGKPTITAAHNTSSTSIQLSWRAPHPSTLHGEFLGYRIAFKPRNAGQDQVQEVLIKDPGISKYTIQRLQIFTQYLVSLQVQNPEGLGPSTTVVVMTDEGGMVFFGASSSFMQSDTNVSPPVFILVPSMPVNVSMREVTNSSVRVMWHVPSHRNGIIQGYRMYFMQKNFTDVRTVREPQDKMEYLLTGLGRNKLRVCQDQVIWLGEK